MPVASSQRPFKLVDTHFLTLTLLAVLLFLKEQRGGLSRILKVYGISCGVPTLSSIGKADT